MKYRDSDYWQIFVDEMPRNLKEARRIRRLFPPSSNRSRRRFVRDMEAGVLE